MNYTIIPLKIDGAFSVEFDRREDNRGWFSRVYDADVFSVQGIEEPKWVQQNESMTVEAGSVRGMHFQLPPFGETKYVRCTAGSIMDILLDTRELSPTYGVAELVELDSKNSTAVYIPAGCAHGFQSLEADSRIHYLVSTEHKPQFEAGFSIYSKEISSLLPLKIRTISERDTLLPIFEKVNHDSLQ